MTLDLRTTILLCSFSCALMAVVLYAASRNFPRTIGGLGAWALGSALLLPSALLYGLRGMAPDWAAIIPANLGAVTAVALWTAGSERFFGRRRHGAALATLVLLESAGMAWLTLVHPDLRLRLMLFSLTLGPLCLYQVLLVIRGGRRDWASLLFGAAMAIQASVLGTRFVTCLRATALSPDAFATDRVNMLYLTTYHLMTLCLPVAFLMMAIRRLQDELVRLSTLDPLTRTLNRRAFLAASADEAERQRRHRRPMSLLAIDLDHFKAVNDRFGHGVGDEVLQRFSRTVAALLRKPDLLGRFGGEEFMVLLPETAGDAALIVANRIRDAIAADPAEPRYSVSIGVASGDDDVIDGLIPRADRALYRAKALGRDRIEAAAPA